LGSIRFDYVKQKEQFGSSRFEPIRADSVLVRFGGNTVVGDRGDDENPQLIQGDIDSRRR
jgi:hypothetical protein